MRTEINFGDATEYPGERAAIRLVCNLAEQHGYGNLIHRLLVEWSAVMEQDHGFPPGSQMKWGSDEIAERAARQDKIVAALQAENNHLLECCESLLPFALHARARGIHKGDHNLRTPVLSHGSSYLTIGTFQSAYESAVESGLLKEIDT